MHCSSPTMPILTAFTMFTASLTTASAIAAQPRLIGVTSSGGVVEIDLDDGSTTPLFTVQGGGSLEYEPQTGMLVAKLADDAASELLFFDPVTGDEMPSVPVTGLPSNFENLASIGYGGIPGTLFFTLGPTGTTHENRLVQIGIDGVVQNISEDLGIGDNDGVLWDESNHRIIVHDYNASDGFFPVVSVDDPFGAFSVTPVAEPPFRNNVGDSAIHPENGRLFTIGFGSSGGFLIEIVGDNYSDFAPFDTADQIFGIAFVPDSCPADTNNDGSLTPADFTAWIAAFNAGEPECDQNGDGSCTPADFTAWIANYNAGC